MSEKPENNELLERVRNQALRRVGEGRNYRRDRPEGHESAVSSKSLIAHLSSGILAEVQRQGAVGKWVKQAQLRDAKALAEHVIRGLVQEEMIVPVESAGRVFYDKGGKFPAPFLPENPGLLALTVAPGDLERAKNWVLACCYSSQKPIPRNDFKTASNFPNVPKQWPGIERGWSRASVVLMQSDFQPEYRVEALRQAIAALCEEGRIDPVPVEKKRTAYRITEAGKAHFENVVAKLDHRLAPTASQELAAAEAGLGEEPEPIAQAAPAPGYCPKKMSEFLLAAMWISRSTYRNSFSNAALVQHAQRQSLEVQAALESEPGVPGSCPSLPQAISQALEDLVREGKVEKQEVGRGKKGTTVLFCLSPSYIRQRMDAEAAEAAAPQRYSICALEEWLQDIIWNNTRDRCRANEFKKNVKPATTALTAIKEKLRDLTEEERQGFMAKEGEVQTAPTLQEALAAALGKLEEAGLVVESEAGGRTKHTVLSPSNAMIDERLKQKPNAGHAARIGVERSTVAEGRTI